MMQQDELHHGIGGSDPSHKGPALNHPTCHGGKDVDTEGSILTEKRSGSWASYGNGTQIS